MTDHEDFMVAIIANPDDDLPRLVYADWLDRQNGLDSCTWCRGGFIPGPSCDSETPQKCEYCGGTGSVTNGTHERAEFIRVQCELATGGNRCRSPRFPRRHPHMRHIIEAGRPCGRCRPCALRRREGQLLGAHCREWCSPGCAGAGLRTDGSVEVRIDGQAAWAIFRRGFVSELVCAWDQWQAFADIILAAAPIRRVDRAPRRPCDGLCGGDGIAAREHDCRPCPDCDGAGTLPAERPEWKGDGLVRLTTWPDVYYHATNLDGREVLRVGGCGLHAADAVNGVIAEWTVRVSGPPDNGPGAAISCGPETWVTWNSVVGDALTRAAALAVAARGVPVTSTDYPGVFFELPAVTAPPGRVSG
jgi:uncharacterized protein (TIGR02996 family)